MNIEKQHKMCNGDSSFFSSLFFCRIRTKDPSHKFHWLQLLMLLCVCAFYECSFIRIRSFNMNIFIHMWFVLNATVPFYLFNPVFNLKSWLLKILSACLCNVCMMNKWTALCGHNIAFQDVCLNVCMRLLCGHVQRPGFSLSQMFFNIYECVLGFSLNLTSVKVNETGVCYINPKR